MALESPGAEDQDLHLGGTEEIQIIRLAELIWKFAGMQRPFKATFLPGFPMDVPRQLLSIEKAGQILGWQPEIRFDEGLAEVVA